ncbi:hypothetical protein BH10CYA1_BH10CYA1_34760 [soil metagenome]
MKFPITRPHVLLTLSILCTNANQACFASRGDLIARTVPQQSSVRTYRVVGWQNELTAANPNLGNFYWEPLTKRIINTTKTTSKGATAAPAIVPNRSAHYQKPIHAARPVTNSVQLHTDAVLPHSANLPTAQHISMQPVLVYQSPSSQRQSDLTTVASFTSKESVYGVVKAITARSVR